MADFIISDDLKLIALETRDNSNTRNQSATPVKEIENNASRIAISYTLPINQLPQLFRRVIYP